MWAALWVRALRAGSFRRCVLMSAPRGHSVRALWGCLWIYFKPRFSLRVLRVGASPTGFSMKQGRFARFLAGRLHWP